MPVIVIANIDCVLLIPAQYSLNSITACWKFVKQASFNQRSLRHYLRGMCASLLRAIQALLGKLAPPRRPNTNTGAQRHPNLKSLLKRLAAFSPQNKLAGGKLVSGL